AGRELVAAPARATAVPRLATPARHNRHAPFQRSRGNSCLSVADWACLRWPWNRACSSAALASPAAAGQSGVIATEHPRVRFATQDVLGRAPSPPSAT